MHPVEAATGVLPAGRDDGLSPRHQHRRSHDRVRFLHSGSGQSASGPKVAKQCPCIERQVRANRGRETHVQACAAPCNQSASPLICGPRGVCPASCNAVDQRAYSLIANIGLLVALAARAIKAAKPLRGTRCEKSRWRRTVRTAAAMIAAPSGSPTTRLAGRAIPRVTTIDGRLHG